MNKTIILTIITVLAFLTLYVSRSADLKKYDAHMCATWGYEADCVTPLK